MSRSSELVLPTLSLGERQRRWDKIRQMMAKNDVEVLLVIPGSWVFDIPPEIYFTNDMPGSVVVFPIDGEPVSLYRAPYLAGTWMQSEKRGEDTWVRDLRFQADAATIVRVLQEKCPECGRVGTINATGGSHFTVNGMAPYTLWQDIIAQLPNTEFVELWADFSRLCLVKSEEELALFRHAAHVGEIVCEVMLEVTRPGKTEADIYAAVQNEIMRHGVHTPGLILHSGPANPSWNTPRWLLRAQPTRTLQSGDVVVSELFPTAGPLQAQLQMCIALGDVDDRAHTLARVARESYEVGIAKLRAGALFEDVASAMEEPLQSVRAWHLTPLIHSLNPLDMAGRVTDGIHQIRGLTERFGSVNGLSSPPSEGIIEAGMTFSIQPNACLDWLRINIGGNVIVTENGCEELNKLPCNMHVV